jgi:GH35 family endo-1,4-beta-xylanase
MELNAYRTLWADEEIESRIAAGIERHRMSPVTIRVVDEAGRLLVGADVEVEQVASDFRFGANCFMLGGYADAGAGLAYEQAFADLFNAATVPFYWKGLEPERGRPRFGKDSPPLSRRPPPDLALEFCRRHGLVPLGHTLVWDLAQWSVPEWLPEDPAESEPLWERRVAEIATRYAGLIPRWDVLNEVVTGWPRAPRSRRMPDDYACKAFVWAERHFGRSGEFWFNEVTECWTELRASALDLIARLRAGGARLAGLGLQFHLFSEAEVRAVTEGLRFRPRDLFAALDAYGALALPLHVSEITLPELRGEARGEALQAELARNFYRLWFSHPAVEAITWWNLPDGGAAAGEDGVLSGLLRADLSRKPAYEALRRLIREEWRTRCRLVTDERGEARFRGFHGRYRVRAGGCLIADARLARAGAGSDPGPWVVTLGARERALKVLVV